MASSIKAKSGTISAATTAQARIAAAQAAQTIAAKNPAMSSAMLANTAPVSLAPQQQLQTTTHPDAQLMAIAQQAANLAKTGQQQTGTATRSPLPYQAPSGKIPLSVGFHPDPPGPSLISPLIGTPAAPVQVQQDASAYATGQGVGMYYAPSGPSTGDASGASGGGGSSYTDPGTGSYAPPPDYDPGSYGVPSNDGTTPYNTPSSVPPLLTPQTMTATNTAAMTLASAATPAAVTTAAPGILRRIWNWFFGPSTPAAPAAATIHGDPSTSMPAAAASLVRRARAGEQNAMATIALIQENSAHSPVAKAQYDQIIGYIRQNPVAAFSADPVTRHAHKRIFDAAVHLSKGPVLVNSRVYGFTQDFTAAECEAFADGMYGEPSNPDPNLTRANTWGRTIALARKLQAARNPSLRNQFGDS